MPETVYWLNFHYFFNYKNYKKIVTYYQYQTFDVIELPANLGKSYYSWSKTQRVAGYLEHLSEY